MNKSEMDGGGYLSPGVCGPSAVTGDERFSCRGLDAPVASAQRLLHLAFFPERDYHSWPQSVSSLSDQKGSDERSAVLNSRSWDFPGSPVAKSLPCSAGHVRSLSGWGAKTPHASEQLSLPAAAGDSGPRSSASSPLAGAGPRQGACSLLGGLGGAGAVTRLDTWFYSLGGLHDNGCPRSGLSCLGQNGPGGGDRL